MTEPARRSRVGFISTRIAGTDGVSLEIAKWTEIFQRNEVECFFITVESDRPAERTALIEAMHFEHPEIKAITDQAFSQEIRPPQLTARIIDWTQHLKRSLQAAIDRFRLDAIIPENALTIPMNLPLGIALVELIQETCIGCLAHHHDFYWERDRFLVNCVDDILNYAFPPPLPQIQHVVINSLAGAEFSRRTGLSCRIIPNVMDFDSPPPPPDDYARSFRRKIGLDDDDILVLQPTRVVERKGIEHTIELIRRLDPERAKLVITHAVGDEGGAYARYIREFSSLLGVEILFVADRIAAHRGTVDDGSRLFTLEDVYCQADLVAYPSEYEGFGNAFLEAVYHKRPVLCNRYAIYRTDIEPCGFRTILFEGFLREETVAEVRKVLEDETYRREMVEHNYKIASRFFGYHVVEDEIRFLFQRPQNVYRWLARTHRGAQARRVD